MRRLSFVIAVLLITGACGDDGEVATRTDVPPWGLTQIDMPDTEEEIEELFAALPDTIDGRTRSGVLPGQGGPSVHYGAAEEQGLILSAFSVDQMPTPDGEPLTPLEFLTILTGEMDGMEGSSLDPGGPLVWMAAGGTAETGPDTVEAFYVATWAKPEGMWVFDVNAPSAQERTSLIHAFIEAAER